MWAQVRTFFLTRTLRAQEIKAKVDKWDHIRLKSFCTAKETMTRVKKESTDWENVFSGYSLD
jgi:hypothetical protein